MASRNTDYYQIEAINNNGQADGYTSACFFISIRQYLESIGHLYSVQQLMDLAEYPDRNIDFQTGLLTHLVSLNKLIKALTIRLGRPIRINVHQSVPGRDGIINNPDRVPRFLQFGPRGSLYNIDIYQTNYTHYELIVNINGIQLVDTTRIANLEKFTLYHTDTRRKPIEPIQRPYTDTDGTSIDSMLRQDDMELARVMSRASIPSFSRQNSDDELEKVLAMSRTSMPRFSRQNSDEDLEKALAMSRASIPSFSRQNSDDELEKVFGMPRASINKSKCNIPDSQKNICGDYKTSQLQCADMKCCWKENKHGPKCYFPLDTPTYSPSSKPKLSETQKMDRLEQLQRNIEDLQNEREQYKAAFGGSIRSEYEINIDKQIQEYSRELDRLFESKYLKYKNKYLKLQSNFK